MNEIELVKEELIRNKDRMQSLLQETPDDRLHWKPSPTSRSIVEIVAHSANALDNICSQMSGTTFDIPTSFEANKVFLDHDSQFESRVQVRDYLDEKCNKYVSSLDLLRPEDLDRMVTLPFKLGQAPLGFFMTMGSLHTLGHIAQIEYIQTIYGDQSWHTGF